MARTYKATVKVDFKINENGVLTEYKKGDTYKHTSRKRIKNLRINKLLE
jgi:hypothetical protein